MNQPVSKKQALIVDDDPIIRIIMKKLLQGADFEVIEAATAAEGLQACDHKIPNVILLDVQLPDLSGFEVCQRLRNYYTKQELPILMVTGTVESEDVAYSFSVGANDFVSKPIDNTILLARIENQIAVSEAQKELELSRGKISRALEIQRTMGDQLPQAIVLEDDAGGILYANKKFSEWCGNTEQRSLLTSFEWLFGGGFRDQLAALWSIVHEEKRQFLKEELTAIKKVIECICKEVPSRESAKQRLWVFEDMTSKRALETAASQRVKFDTLGLFSSGVAHNFNNLLSGILGSAELIEKTIQDNQRTKRCLEIIRVSVEAGRNLTRKLSAMLRKSGFESETVRNARASIEAVIACYEEASEGKISYILNIPEGLPQLAIADSNFVDVVANLVSNSIDAIDDAEGAIAISASVNPSGEHVLFTVTDNGRGIDQNEINRLFEPFYSTKHLDTKNGVSCTGNGLGLWTVYSLVSASQGSVQITSAVGSGTTVKIELPVVNMVKPITQLPEQVEEKQLH